MKETDVLIIGCGIAGCTTALALAKKGIDVTIVASDKPEVSCSYEAQGGIVYKGVGDSVKKIINDVCNAGAGLCSPDVVKFVVEKGPETIEEVLLGDLDVNFDREADGSLHLTKEGAHLMPRILCSRDHTGKTIINAFIKKLQEFPNVTLLFNHTVVDLITWSHHSVNPIDIYRKPTCVGAYVFDNERRDVEIFFAKETVLATGRVSSVFLHTTNPSTSRGAGIAMAYRAGARIMNMEYIQFHPTSLYIPHGPRFLLSEALRGEGAKLLSIEGKSFMHEYHEMEELAPRDTVARSIYLEMLKSKSDHVWLDMTFKDSNWIKNRFPTIYKRCCEAGHDMTTELIPVVPAAHYSCGGIAIDNLGRTSVHRLRAVGEVSCTGLHGANRLASMSLLEGLVCGKFCGQDIADNMALITGKYPEVHPWVMGTEPVDPALIQQDWMIIRETMWNYVGLVRGQHRLKRAWRLLNELSAEISDFYGKSQLIEELLSLRNGIKIALLITQGSLRNKTSRGCHYISLR
jgi:L-aspartate oxidase